MTNQQDKLYRERVLKGDVDAFSYFVDTYQNLAFTIALRITNNREEAEDTVQEAFLKCFHSLHSFKGDSKFSTWFYRIVYRKALDKVRKNSRQVFTEEISEVDYQLIDEVDDALEILDKKEKKIILNKAIQKLHPEEQTIISLYYFEDLAIKEIATVIGISESNIKIKLFRARKQLFALLQGDLKLINRTE
ncbi:RNA polymerase sigma factor [Galbibacter sp. BG1]|uniref:RNA polymerase sigma factor n=1 Tax=Galbibacter sp. BG1 TaxID=1170699 RepID=UPI0015B873DB|nr:RNA polymerase sigma factor [Galbibacter sp. BG1]QLE00441.1 RNA polymerase sigma factor [Galbibacter sp. BG1]